MFINCPYCGFLVALDAQGLPLPRCPNCAQRLRDESDPAKADAHATPPAPESTPPAPATPAPETPRDETPRDEAAPATVPDGTRVSDGGGAATSQPRGFARFLTRAWPTAPKAAAADAPAATRSDAATDGADTQDHPLLPAPAPIDPASLPVPVSKRAPDAPALLAGGATHVQTSEVIHLAAWDPAGPAGTAKPDESVETLESVEPESVEVGAAEVVATVASVEAGETAAIVETVEAAEVEAQTEADAGTELDALHEAPRPDADAAPGEAGAAATDAETADTAAAPAARKRQRRPANAAPSFARAHRAMRTASRKHRILQAAAVLGLSLLLAVQLLVADRARLAGDARWRPLVTTACGALRCTVPAWREPAAFHVVERDVRAGAPGVLRVSARIRNDARWAQPWPALQLTLSDTHGRAVATRIFQPREYLGGGPTQPRLESGQDASLSMDIVEPGSQAVAFTFDFK